MAGELDINPVIISEMEEGNIFPGFEYLYHCRTKLGLNVNWLINGTGSMFSSLTLEVPLDTLNFSYLKIEEVPRILENPAILQVLLARITELSFFYIKERKDSQEPVGKKVYYSPAMVVKPETVRRRHLHVQEKEPTKDTPA